MTLMSRTIIQPATCMYVMSLSTLSWVYSTTSPGKSSWRVTRRQLSLTLSTELATGRPFSVRIGYLLKLPQFALHTFGSVVAATEDNFLAMKLAKVIPHLRAVIAAVAPFPFFVSHICKKKRSPLSAPYLKRCTNAPLAQIPIVGCRRLCGLERERM